MHALPAEINHLLWQMKRMIRRYLAVCVGGFALGALLLKSQGEEKSPLQLVDPRIGTAHCRWFFFTPGAMPFGMAKLGP